MKRCEKCGVEVTGNRLRCPLCQGTLLQTTGETREIFPVVPTLYRQYHLLFRLLIFASVAVGVVAVAVNLLLPESGAWSVFVAGGIICVWLSLALAVRKRKNIPKGMLYQVAQLSIICMIWDFATGWNGWSIDYVLPILCVAAMAALAVLSRVFNWETENQMIYFCIDAIFGIVPSILFFAGCLRVPYPSVISMAVSLLSLAAVAVFRGDSIWAELKRRLHI